MAKMPSDLVCHAKAIKMLTKVGYAVSQAQIILNHARAWDIDGMDYYAKSYIQQRAKD